MDMLTAIALKMSESKNEEYADPICFDSYAQDDRECSSQRSRIYDFVKSLNDGDNYQLGEQVDQEEGDIFEQEDQEEENFDEE